MTNGFVVGGVSVVVIVSVPISGADELAVGIVVVDVVEIEATEAVAGGTLQGRLIAACMASAGIIGFNSKWKSTWNTTGEACGRFLNKVEMGGSCTTCCEAAREETADPGVASEGRAVIPVGGNWN